MSLERHQNSWNERFFISIMVSWTFWFDEEIKASSFPLWFHEELFDRRKASLQWKSFFRLL